MGPIALDEALPIAKQIAEALEAAHEAGVIHRDLKPANIKVRQDGTVKVLDFGLAKALDATPQGDPSLSPTLTAAATQMGVIMGTAAYMSPEQAQGKPVDKRADVWAFGVVLFEMVTGQPAFAGNNMSDVLASVIKSEPDWEILPKALSPLLGRFLRRCLVKAPKQRLHDVADVRLAIEGAFDTGGGPTAEPVGPRFAVWQRPAPAIAAALMLIAITSFAVWAVTRPDVVPADLMRFTMVSSETVAAPLGSFTAAPDLAISPDGTQVVFGGPAPGGAPRLNLRPLAQLVGTPLRGGEGGVGPFISPDGQWVGFADFRGTRTLKKVSIFGGSPMTLTESPYSVMGASWGADDRIIFGTPRTGLLRASEGSGEPEPLTTLDRGRGDVAHTWPFIIPGREAVVFVISTAGPLTTGQLAVLDLDTKEVTRLGLAGVSPHYVSTGHLVYAVEDGSLRAVPFDARSLAVTGDPVLLGEDVLVKDSGAADFNISDNGRLVYVSGAGDGGLQRALVWVERDGSVAPIDNAPLRGYIYPRISPDGAQVAVNIQDPSDIWVWDFAGEALTPLTVGARAVYGHWTPDGRRVVFSSVRDGRIYSQAADGTGVADRLTQGDRGWAVTAVTPAGTHVIATAGSDLFVVELDGDHATETLLSTEFDNRNAALSPDGEWIAYGSNESGQFEIYVRPFPDVEAGRFLVSTAGGQDPVWSRAGRELELFYWADNLLMAASIQTDPSFSRRMPRVLFEGS